MRTHRHGYNAVTATVPIVIVLAIHAIFPLALGLKGLVYTLALSPVTGVLGIAIWQGELFNSLIERMGAWSTIRSFEVSRRARKDMV
jgi:hypothetical protein